MKVNRGDAPDDEFENLVTEVDSLGSPKATLFTYKLIGYDHGTGAIQYIGPIKATPVSAIGLASKEACVLLRIWYCDWEGDVHYARANCTPEYMWEETTWFCYEDGTGNSGGSDPGDGNGGNLNKIVNNFYLIVT